MRCRVSCPNVPPLRMTQVLERVERISDGLEGGVETVANYELFVGASQSLPTFVLFRLDTCRGGVSGGGALTLYLCDEACIDPMSPADPANAGRATVVSADNGTAVTAIRMPPYVLYAAVATPASSSSSWVYSLAVAATNYAWRLEANPYLSFRAPMGSDGTAGFTVLWSPLYIVSPYDGSFSLAVGALYTVVVLTGSSPPSDVVNTTVCGVYDTITGHGARTYNTSQLNMTVTGLTLGVSYSVAVVATCNAQCLTANNRSSDVILNGDGVAYSFAVTAAVPAASASSTPSTTRRCACLTLKLCFERGSTPMSDGARVIVLQLFDFAIAFVRATPRPARVCCMCDDACGDAIPTLSLRSYPVLAVLRTCCRILWAALTSPQGVIDGCTF